ncbi:hypothetical protein [Pseudomonas arcuscaelestis]|uniref:hypothetical protein n=1 Tax=Pseudomonas arcuscaelestis TaxID=2710591 RepID=UPI00193D7EAA|nr:hypothetical protein [Pseudomonas arcuscaelestis]MBM3109091.1 hypothetical protein [Pseudomonas arcuscaelestis]
MSIVNGVGWQQQVINPLRGTSEATAEPQAQYRPPVATSGAAAQQQNRGNTAQQHADDAREEAFAKLKVQLQNPDVARREQAGAAAADAPTTSAAQEFRDYMALSPAEKIKLKLLNELGITEEEFNALPPEQREIIGRKIAELLNKETELQSLATLNAHIQEPELSASLVTQLTPADSAQTSTADDPREKDPLI